MTLGGYQGIKRGAREISNHENRNQWLSSNGRDGKSDEYEPLGLIPVRHQKTVVYGQTLARGFLSDRKCSTGRG